MPYWCLLTKKSFWINIFRFLFLRIFESTAPYAAHARGVGVAVVVVLDPHLILDQSRTNRVMTSSLNFSVYDWAAPTLISALVFLHMSCPLELLHFCFCAANTQSAFKRISLWGPVLATAVDGSSLAIVRMLLENRAEMTAEFGNLYKMCVRAGWKWEGRFLRKFNFMQPREKTFFRCLRKICQFSSLRRISSLHWNFNPLMHVQQKRLFPRCNAALGKIFAHESFMQRNSLPLCLLWRLLQWHSRNSNHSFLFQKNRHIWNKTPKTFFLSRPVSFKKLLKSKESAEKKTNSNSAGTTGTTCNKRKGGCHEQQEGCLHSKWAAHYSHIIMIFWSCETSVAFPFAKSLFARKAHM